MSQIKGYYASRNGKGYFVPAHSDSRQKHDKDKVLPVDPGMAKMRDTITNFLRTKEGQKELEDKIKAGGFRKTIPEVVHLYGVEQGAHHPLPDAFDHTMEVVRRLPPDADDNTRWAALLHDIGKVDAQRVDPKRGTIFDGHEYVGYKQSKAVLRRLGFDQEDADEIRYLIRHHGSLRTVFLRGDEDDAKDFIDHPHFDNLLKLHEADVRASNRDPHEVLEKVKELKTQQ